MSFCNVTCKCGFTDSLDNFTSGLPAKEYRCPRCGLHTQVVDAPATIYPSGFIMPGARSVRVLKEGAVAK